MEKRDRYDKPDKYHGFDKQFYDFLFDYVVKNGGLRLQIVAADLVNDLQNNFDAKHNLNLFRKQYGNIYEALKPIKDQFYILDSMVIRMKKPSEVEALFKSGKIRKDSYDKYLQKLQQNEVKQIQIMKINNENKCTKCGDTYNINVNRADSCKGKSKHEPKY